MLLDIIDHPANIDNYKINFPQIQPRTVKPTQSVMEIPKPVQAAPATPPPLPLEAIEEDPELEPEKQEEESQQGEIDMIPLIENVATEISKNKQCINNSPGIEISEYDDTNFINPGNSMEYSCIIPNEKSIPKPHHNAQVNIYSDIKSIKEETLEMTQSDDKGQSSQKVPPSPNDSGQQEEGSGYHRITVEIHDY